MIPEVKGRVSKQAHVQIPDGLYEEEHGRDGFFGPVSHLYREHPPTGWTRIEGPLKPQAFNTLKTQNAIGDPCLGRSTILYNQDVALHVARAQTPMDYYFRNADADDVLFVHKGSGRLETDFGPLLFTKGDYLVIPRGTTYRVLSDDPDTFFLVIESFSRIRQPDRGMLGQHALYDPAVIRTPEPHPCDDEGKNEWEVKIKRQNQITSVFYPFNPLDVVGWKGDLTVWQLNIDEICPVISHKAHLAPSVHTTFLAKNFVICSFVPRPLESAPGALRVPFYHRNIDYDEVLFYHDGDFFSRDGIDAGMITFHPQGIHHGPHPKALQTSWDKTETNEVAVMVDTLNPLTVHRDGAATEWAAYPMSWQEASTV